MMRLWAARRLVWQHAAMEYRTRYSGSLLGGGWNVLHPLAMIAIYALVFTEIMSVRTGALPGGLDYVLYLCWGIFPWLAFSECIARGGGSLTENAGTIKKYPIPEEAFVAKSIVVAGMGLVIPVALLLVATAILRPPADPAAWLMLPVPLLALLAFGFGLAMLISGIAVFFRDAYQLVMLLLPLGMWTLPIVYVPEILPERIRWMLDLHPLWPFFEAIRGIALDGALPAPRSLALMAAIATVAIALAALFLRRTRAEIRDAL